MPAQQQQTSEQDPENQENEAEKASENADSQTESVIEDEALNRIEQAQESEDEDITAELTQAQAKIKDYWDQIMRLNAEIENNRRRAQRDIENAHKYAIKNFAESLLPVTDSMELGLTASDEKNANLDSIRQGMSMTLDMLTQTLQKNSISSIDPLGEKFNPEHHQAVTMQEHEEAEPNTVIAVLQKGYLLNDRLIRPAMVVVCKEKSE